MSPNTSIKRNFAYNFAFNIISMIFPLITIPYVSRVLGADKLGLYNFAIAFSNWFLVFAAFGTTTYGVREIAKIRDDRILLDKIFSEVFFINAITTFFTLLIYIMVVCIIPKTSDEIMLFMIMALLILLNLFCVDWLYMGLENFKIITLRSLFIKITCLISVFLFIKQENDYIIYALITVFAFGISNIFNFVYSRKFVKLTFINIRIKHHVRQLLIFFGSNLVVSLYTLFDQILLGIFSTNKDIAFYASAKQLYLVALSITLSISTVLLPKASYLFNNDFGRYKKLLQESIRYIYIISVPSVIGLIVLSKDLMYFWGGSTFDGAYVSLMILAILVFTVALGTWQYDQIFVPMGKEKIGLKIQFFMAICSISSNLFLIPKFGFIGASVSLLFTEIVGTIYGVWYAKNKISAIQINYLDKSLLAYVLSAIIMGIIINLFHFMGYGYIVNIISGILIGPIIYFGLLYFLKDYTCRTLITYFVNVFKF